MSLYIYGSGLPCLIYPNWSINSTTLWELHVVPAPSNKKHASAPLLMILLAYLVAKNRRYPGKGERTSSKNRCSEGWKEMWSFQISPFRSHILDSYYALSVHFGAPILVVEFVWQFYSTPFFFSDFLCSGWSFSWSGQTSSQRRFSEPIDIHKNYQYISYRSQLLWNPYPGLDTTRAVGPV